jgi:hypothetical protein
MTQSNPPSRSTAQVAVLNPTSSPALEKYYDETLENIRKLLPDAARQLKGAGVVRVDIEYDGSGDSGQIESLAYFDREGKEIDPAAMISITEDALMDLFYDLSQVRHPGWENGEGACGDFHWDLTADTLQHTHHHRFVDSETTEQEGV